MGGLTRVDIPRSSNKYGHEIPRRDPPKDHDCEPLRRRTVMSVFKKQGVYWIDYYVDGHRKRERIGPDKRLAETVLRSARWRSRKGDFWRNSSQSPQHLMSWRRYILSGFGRTMRQASQLANVHGAATTCMPLAGSAPISAGSASPPSHPPWSDNIVTGDDRPSHGATARCQPPPSTVSWLASNVCSRWRIRDSSSSKAGSRRTSRWRSSAWSGSATSAIECFRLKSMLTCARLRRIG